MVMVRVMAMAMAMECYPPAIATLPNPSLPATVRRQPSSSASCLLRVRNSLLSLFATVPRHRRCHPSAFVQLREPGELAGYSIGRPHRLGGYISGPQLYPSAMDQSTS